MTESEDWRAMKGKKRIFANSLAEKAFFMTEIFHIDRATIAIEYDIPCSDALLESLTLKDRYRSETAKMPEHRRREWLAVRVLLKQLTGEEKEICYLPTGKPYMADGSNYLSISHSRGIAAVMISPETEVAIDIEKISRRVKNVASRFMSERELATVVDDDILHILIHWTAKEAMYKLLDCADVNFRRDIHIEPFRPVKSGWDELTAGQTIIEPHSVHTIHYMVSDNVVLSAIC